MVLNFDLTPGSFWVKVDIWQLLWLWQIGRVLIQMTTSTVLAPCQAESLRKRQILSNKSFGAKVCDLVMGRVQKNSECNFFPSWCWPSPPWNVNFLTKIKKKKWFSQNFFWCSQNLPKHILLLKKSTLKPLFAVYRFLKM